MGVDIIDITRKALKRNKMSTRIYSVKRRLRFTVISFDACSIASEAWKSAKARSFQAGETHSLFLTVQFNFDANYVKLSLRLESSARIECSDATR